MSRRAITLADLGPSARRQVEDARIAETLREVAARAEKPKRKHKFNAQPVEVDGIWFASKAEAKRWTELRLSERAGTITDLIRQPRFKLSINGIAICTYVADFSYLPAGSDKRCIEDVKGVVTAAYRIKRALMKALYGITIQEVRK